MNRLGLITRWALLALVCTLPMSAMRAPRHDPAALDPEDRAGYLEVGEWLAATAGNEHERALARAVLAIGIGLADRAGEHGLGASLCIALADAEPDARWSSLLWDLALLQDPSRLDVWARHRDTRERETVDLRQQAASCLYFARHGDHAQASSRFAQGDIHRLILSTAQRLGIDAQWVDRTITEMLAQSENDPCRGRVFIRKTEDGRALRMVCPDHTRPIGTGPSDEALGQLLRIESALLGRGAQASDGAVGEDWVTAGYLGRTGAAIDPTVAAVLAHYGVDPARPYWRRGDWSAAR